MEIVIYVTAKENFVMVKTLEHFMAKKDLYKIKGYKSRKVHNGFYFYIEVDENEADTLFHIGTLFEFNRNMERL